MFKRGNRVLYNDGFLTLAQFSPNKHSVTLCLFDENWAYSHRTGFVISKDIALPHCRIPNLT